METALTENAEKKSGGMRGILSSRGSKLEVQNGAGSPHSASPGPGRKSSRPESPAASAEQIEMSNGKESAFSKMRDTLQITKPKKKTKGKLACSIDPSATPVDPYAPQEINMSAVKYADPFDPQNAATENVEERKVGQGHDFKTVSVQLNKAEPCDCCGELAWGLSRQVVKCSKCDLTVHRKYESKVIGDCPISAAVPTIMADEPAGVSSGTAFYLPTDTNRLVHISNTTTTKELVQILLKKFCVTDNPKKFSLYEEYGSDCRRLFEEDYPLEVVLEANCAHRNSKLVLRDNTYHTIQWEAIHCTRTEQLHSDAAERGRDICNQASSPAPSPAPIAPSPAPTAPSPTPTAPSPAPIAPSPAPIAPSPAPIAPSPAPTAPSPVPTAPSPAPTAPSPAPIAPSPAPTAPSPAPTAPSPAPSPTPTAPSPVPTAPSSAPTAPSPVASSEQTTQSSPALQLAKPNQQAELPPGWEVARTNDGLVYCINTVTHTSQWERPKPVQPIATPNSDLPVGCEAARTSDGRVYYMHRQLKVVTWDKPFVQNVPLDEPVPPPPLSIPSSQATLSRGQGAGTQLNSPLPPQGTSPSPQQTPLTGPSQQAPPTAPSQQAPPTRPSQQAPPTGPSQQAPPTRPSQQALPTGPSQQAPPTGSFQQAPPTGSFQQALPTGPSQQALPTGPSQQAPPTGSFQQAPPTGSFQQALPTGPSQQALPTGPSQQAPPTGPSQQAPPTGSFQQAPPTGSFQQAPPTGPSQQGLIRNPQGVLNQVTSSNSNQSQLPPGWESERTPEGYVYYFNPNTRQSQWTDPRLQSSSSASPLTTLAAPSPVNPSVTIRPDISIRRAAPLPPTMTTPLPPTMTTPLPATMATPLPATMATPRPSTMATPLPVNMATPLPATMATPRPSTMATPLPVNMATPLSPPTSQSPLVSLQRQPSPLPPTLQVPSLTPAAEALNRASQGLPPGWAAALSVDGHVYYINHLTRSTRWDRPSINQGRPLPEIPGGPQGVQASGIAQQAAAPMPLDVLGPLPPGWESRIFSGGRLLFINHNDKTTHWKDPRTVTCTLGRPNSQMVSTAMGTQGTNFTTPQGATSQRTTPLGATFQGATPQGATSQGATSQGATSQGAISQGATPQGATSQGATSQGATVVRLQRSSFSISQGSLALQPTSSAPEPDLPNGWEARTDPNENVYYVDHINKITTWTTDTLGPLPHGWELKTGADGHIYFVDHNTKSTQWEDPRLEAKNKPAAKLEYSRDYKQKLVNFRTKLPSTTSMARLTIPVHRNNLWEDSFRAIMNVKYVQQFHLRPDVKFDGEREYDYGGLSREWFHLLSKEIFHPYYGLFEHAASNDYTLQISPNSGLYNPGHLDYFKFIGRVCGLAIYNNMIIDAFFIRPFYKTMLGKNVTLEDMQDVDMEIYNSLQYVLENDPEPLCMNFSVSNEILGQVQEIDLKPNGRNIPLAETNKKEYVNLMVKWRLVERVKEQMSAFMKGFGDVISPKLIQVFDERELECLMGGLAEIDVEDWKKNTLYSEYKPTDDVIVWFWKVVSNYDKEMRARLLQFVTGTSKVPMNGFAELQGSQGSRKFAIKKFGSVESFPRAHTCFNVLDLPPYTDFQTLERKLTIAIENTEGFSGVD